MDTKKTTSIRLSEDGKQLRKKLAKKLGLSESAVIELAIRRLAGMEDVKMEEKQHPSKELSPVV